MTSRRPQRPVVHLFALLAAVAVAIAGCSSPSLSSLPAPGQDLDDAFTITMEFADVLNLPDDARVVMDGTPVGRVVGTAVIADHVEVSTRIRDGISVPASINASLQQNTVLGEIYIALSRPPDAPPLPLLEPGGTVPLAQTQAPPPLEDTMAVLATFFTSGSVQRIQSTITGVNAITPVGDGRVRRLSARTADDLAALASDLDTVDRWLDGVEGTTEAARTNAPVLQWYLSPAGMQAWDRATYTATYISTILPSIGSIYEGGFWLVPLFNSLADTTGAVKGAGVDVLADGPEWHRLLVRIARAAQNPTLDVTAVRGPDGTDLTPQVAALLRMLGALR